MTVSDDRIYEYNDTAVWTLGVTDAGTYQFKTADGKKLSMAATRTSMPLDDANDTWNITAVTGNNGVFFIDNTGRAGYRIEWYSTNNNWSAYNNNATGDLFQQQIFRITEGEAPSNIPVASITLNDTTLSLDIGETAQLTAEVLPETATDKSVTWASDDPTVATVDGNGLVTAVALGTASITVTANDGSGVNAICGVRVNDPEAVFTDGLVTDLSQLKDGSKVVIYNDSAAKAISTSVLQSYYLSPVDVTIQDDKAMNPAAEAVWTLGIIENADGTKSYTFSTSEGKKMSMNNDRNSLPLDAENMTWTLPAATTADSWYIVNENRPTYYVEWYARYTEFSTYTYAANNEAIYAMKLYVIAETAEDVPIASLALDHETLDLEAGQTGQLTPVIEPENATNKALTWTSSDEMVATVDVNGLVTAVAAGTATIIATTTDGSDKTASCTVIVAEGSAPTYLEKLTEAPEDGAKVVIYYPVDGLVLTAVPNGKKLTGTAALPADGKLEQTDDMALLTVSTGDNGQYEFVSEDGKYLTSPATGNGLSFADASSDYSKWALSQNADGTWTITNVSAVYNGQQQALEYYSGFTTYGVKDTNVYHFDFYGTNPVTEGLVTDLSTLEDGDLIVVYNESGNYAMSNTTVAQYYRGLETVTIEDDKVVNPAETAIWTLGVSTTDDGTTYTFTTQDGHVLTAGTKNSLPLDDVNPDWTIVPAGTAGYFYIINAGRNTQYIEYYAAKSDFSSYKYVESDDAVYLMKLYKVKKGSTPVEGDTYGLASTIADGDKVILFNEKNKVAIGNTITSYKINGVSLTPVEDVITTDNTAVVWTVVKNADGTYSFTQGDYTLGGYVREDNGKTYNNLTVSDATYTNWTLTGPDSSDFNYFLYLDDMANNYGKMYLEYYNGFTLYGSSSPDKDAFGIRFYKQGADPETPSGEIGDLVTDLNQLEDGTTVAIYSPGHKTAISTRPNGDWYLKANAAYLEGGKVVNFTSDFVWKIRKNADGTYTFVSNDDENNSIAVWRSDTTDANGNPKSYAELTVDSTTYPENKWVLTPAKTANCYYFNNPSVTDDNNYTAYIEAYVRNGTEVYSGYFTNTSSNKFTEKEFALQFYLINPDDAVESFDDGEWDKVLNKDSSYVIYSPSCEKSLGLFKEANYAFDAIDTTIADNKATPGNGAYVFKIDTMGRYYSFEVNGKYMASNNEEELYFVEKGEDGKLPDNAKWYLKPIGEVLTNGTPAYDGYVIFNKDANYKGSAVCIEYYSSVFSGWTFKSNDSSIFIFQFYPVAEGVDVFDDTVQDPSVVFDCNDSRHLEEDYHVSFTLDDLAANITDISISYKVGEKEAVPVTDYETTSDGKGYSFDLKAEDIDGNEKPESFKILVDVTNSYGISYTGEKTVAILDTPFFADLTPAPNAQTGDDKRPVISAKVGNVGEAPTFTMKVNDELVEAVYENGILSWTSAEDMADGRVSVHMICTRADGVSEQQSWSFIVGTSAFQLYFGQLHSHTTYSDGSGTLETALEYIESLPESANVDFVAFTDHSNYFDTTSASNPADAMHDVSLMTPASAALWNQYKETVADFNSKHTDIVAIAGYEMTWSGGPGHINSYNT